eukprot:15408633-Heterocapsa_arctica.AAC.1
MGSNVIRVVGSRGAWVRWSVHEHCGNGQWLGQQHVYDPEAAIYHEPQSISSATDVTAQQES